MKLFTYSTGGIHREDEKPTKNSPFEILQPPSIAIIPLSQHTGAPNIPLVKVGDHVLIGTIIGSSTQFVSAPVHSSVSGEVVAIEDKVVPTGNKVQCVIVKNDLKDEWIERKSIFSLENITNEELIRIIRESGIVGLGGAAFPTAVKLSPPAGKAINTIIANGAECEFYLTTDHRMMLEFPDKIIDGLLVEMKITGASNGIIAVENNKIDAANMLEKRINERHIGNVEVVLVQTKYPQGGEKQLVKAILKKEIPSGCLPLDIGIIVQNVGTLKAIADAVFEGRPLIERGITVSGSAVSKPGNYIVRIGTQAREIIDALGLNEKLRKLIFGGPMTGVAQSTVDVPLVKGTSAILMFGEEIFDMSRNDELPCIRCASCVDKCPVGLMPTLIDYAWRRQNLKAVEELHAVDCIECGVCSYVCPANRDLTENVKKSKQGIIKQKRIEAAKQAAFEKLKAQKLKEKAEKEAKEAQK